MPILGIDTSNHNHPNGARIDFAAVKASGRSFVVLKASEGLGFKDRYLDADRAAAHAAGLIVLLYHFARGNDPAAEAAWFLQCVGPLQVGEGVVLDDEVAGITPAWVKAWCDTVFTKTTVKALVYINQSVQNGQNWSGVVADNDGEWLAKYDGNLTQPAGGAWGSPAMKQYSDAGQVAGIAGGVDLDVFFGTDQQLLAYGLQGADMPLTQADIAAIWNYLLPVSNGFGPGPAWVWLRDGRVDAGHAVTAVNEVHAKVVDARYDMADRPGPDADDLLGHVLSTRAVVEKLPSAQPVAIAAADLKAALLDPDVQAALAAAVVAALDADVAQRFKA